MARTKKVNESEADFESTDLYSDGEGKGAVLQTLDAPDKSKENKKSIAGAAGVEPADHELVGAVEEAFSALFDGEGLSESFKNNVKGLFEATLSERTQQISEEMKVSFQEELEQNVSTVVEELSNKVDEYLNYVVENWLEENKLAVETGMRLQVAESFIENLKGVFENHYISVPDSKVNLLDEMFEKNESLKGDLDEALGINSELLSSLEGYRKNEIAHHITEGLTDLDKQKFFSLAEEVSYESDESYVEKLQGIKESYFTKKIKTPVLKEETHEPEKVVLEENSSMNGYLRAIERNNRFNNRKG